MGDRLRIGDMLVKAGLVTEAHVEEALAAQGDLGLRLGETLVQLGYVDEHRMTQVLSNQLSLPWVSLYHVDFSRELLDRVPTEVADRFGVVPVYVREVRKQGDTLFVAMVDPLDVEGLQAVADASGLPVKAMVASPTDVRNAIRVYYQGLPPAGEEEPEGEVQVLHVDAESMPPAALPSLPPPALPSAALEAPTFRTLTLLDGTIVRLPVPAAEAEEESAGRGLTTRDVIMALRARAAGEDVSDVMDDHDVETLLAALLTVLLKKGLVADWEFIDAWKKLRRD